MNENKTQTTDLEEQIIWLSRAVRALVIAFAVASNIRLWTVLRNGEKFGQMFQDMLDGAALPILTRIFTTYHFGIYAATTALTVTAIALILAQKEKTMLLSFGVLVGFLSYALAETANQAYWQPIHEIIKQLTG
ncbi:MAG: hypothetical protein ACSHX4_06115 [Opitutaceae bacterium]